MVLCCVWNLATLLFKPASLDAVTRNWLDFLQPNQPNIWCLASTTIFRNTSAWEIFSAFVCSSTHIQLSWVSIQTETEQSEATCYVLAGCYQPNQKQRKHFKKSEEERRSWHSRRYINCYSQVVLLNKRLSFWLINAFAFLKVILLLGKPRVA